MSEEPIDEQWLQSIGWVAVGNTWYPPEKSHARQYTMPILMWVRVDGTIRLGGGNEWVSGNDAPRWQLLKLCEALGITIALGQTRLCGKEPYVPYIPEGYHVREDGDYGEVLVKNTAIPDPYVCQKCGGPMAHSRLHGLFCMTCRP